MSPRCSEKPTLKKYFQMYEAVCNVFLPEPGFGPNRCRAVYIYIYIYIYGVVAENFLESIFWMASNTTKQTIYTWYISKPMFVI